MNIGRRGFFGKMLGGAAAVAAMPVNGLMAAAPSPTKPLGETTLDVFGDKQFEIDLAEILRFITAKRDAPAVPRMAAMSLPRATIPIAVYIRNVTTDCPQPNLAHLVEDIRIGRVDRVHRLATAIYDNLTSPLCMQRVAHCDLKHKPVRVTSARYTIDLEEMTPAVLASLIAELPHDLYRIMEALRDSIYDKVINGWAPPITHREYTPMRVAIKCDGPLFDMYVYSEMSIVTGEK